MASDRIVVLGASVGGVEALKLLASSLPADFPAPILVVQHIGSFPSRLPEILSKSGPLPARHAVDRDPIVAGQILFAPPDHHMLVDGDAIRLTRGPKEHHTRPAIDPLFLSAALSRGAGVVGVILTGRGNDGTAGLQAIKECGGKTVVQDPSEALAPDMPRSATTYVEVDHCVSLAGIPGVLESLVQPGSPAPPRTASAPAHWRLEQELMLSKGDPMELLQAIGKPSPFVCPECSGGLWEIKHSRPLRFRCHTGHGYSLDTLQQNQANNTDSALWSAIRALQEKAQLLEMMALTRRNAGEDARSVALDAEARTTQQQADVIRALVEERSSTPQA
jgi:two-component system chemotaxis response regulator CheB